MGGGGTDFMVNWEFMKDQGITPKKFIMFTDGYPCGEWGDENYCDTLFVVKGNTHAESPFGEVVIYEKDVG
jgi:predicted metal-dependent peptidase